MGGVVMIAKPNGYGFRSLFTSPFLDGFGQVAPPCSLPQFTLPEDWENKSLYLRGFRKIHWVNNYLWHLPTGWGSPTGSSGSLSPFGASVLHVAPEGGARARFYFFIF